MGLSKIAVKSPLGPEAFELNRMSGGDGLSRCFTYELELLSTQHDLHPLDLLGQPMSVSLDVAGEQTRYFHGFATALHVGAAYGRYAGYRVTLQSWLWFLTRTSNSRIFQNLSVPDVVKQVFRGHGFSDFEDALSEPHRSFEYLVQYRETDFAFVSRLLEQEGIYYFFRHEEDKHILVLADGYGAHQKTPGYEEIPYFPPNENIRRERDHLDDWRYRQHVLPGEYVLDAYDFTKPRAELKASLRAPLGHERDHFALYDYPGLYSEVADGEKYARVRLQEQHADFDVAQGAGNARGLTSGALFSLTGYPREDQNQEYLVLSTSFELRGKGLESGHGAEEEAVFKSRLTAIPSSVQYRPARKTPRPVVPGPQTARVVGKAGEEIWTDEFGRIKVLFHWDRESTGDENSSCWVRVAQAWAGNGFGTVYIPRIGQEVVVSFLEGDPDQPLVTGSVYNGNMAPPFPLPGKGMVSGVKSDSTPGGGGYNEISLDDSKGKEKILVHGQRDMESTIEHDKKTIVRHNRSANISVNDSESVGANQSVKVGANRELNVGANQNVNIGAELHEAVGKSMFVAVAERFETSVGDVMSESIAADRIEEVGGEKVSTVAKTSSETVGETKNLQAKNTQSNVDEAATANVGKTLSLNVGEDLAVVGGTKGLIEIANELVIQVGQASITLKQSGEVTITGLKIAIEGSAQVAIKGGMITHN